MERKYDVTSEDLYGLVMESAERILNEVDFSSIRDDAAERIFTDAKKSNELEKLVSTRKKEIIAMLKDPKNAKLLNSIKSINPAPVA